MSKEVRCNEVLFRPGTEKVYDTFLHYVQSDSAPPRTVPVVFQWNSPNPYIYFNTEQLTRPECLAELLHLTKQHPPVEVWDYSHINVSILKLCGIDARLVYVQSPSWYVDKLKAMRAVPLVYDVGFCGSMNARRATIFHELQKRGLRINIVQGHGDYRDAELAKCKVLLNIHYTPSYQVFEQARCEPWIQAGVPIVSEHSLDNDVRVVNVGYDQLVDATLGVLSKSSVSN